MKFGWGASAPADRVMTGPPGASPGSPTPRPCLRRARRSPRRPAGRASPRPPLQERARSRAADRRRDSRGAAVRCPQVASAPRARGRSRRMTVDDSRRCHPGRARRARRDCADGTSGSHSSTRSCRNVQNSTIAVTSSAPGGRCDPEAAHLHAVRRPTHPPIAGEHRARVPVDDDGHRTGLGDDRRHGEERERILDDRVRPGPGSGPLVGAVAAVGARLAAGVATARSSPGLAVRQADRAGPSRPRCPPRANWPSRGFIGSRPGQPRTLGAGELAGQPGGTRARHARDEDGRRGHQRSGRPGGPAGPAAGAHERPRPTNRAERSSVRGSKAKTTWTSARPGLRRHRPADERAPDPAQRLPAVTEAGLGEGDLSEDACLTGPRGPDLRVLAAGRTAGPRTRPRCAPGTRTGRPS